jgi:hypothetical protein
MYAMNVIVLLDDGEHLVDDDEFLNMIDDDERGIPCPPAPNGCGAPTGTYCADNCPTFEPTEG